MGDFSTWISGIVHSKVLSYLGLIPQLSGLPASSQCVLSLQLKHPGFEDKGARALRIM